MLRRYELRQLTSAEVVERLIEIAKRLRDSAHRHEELGLSAEEAAAFYDALAGGVEHVQADPDLAALAHDLITSIRQDLTVDWTDRAASEAKVRTKIRRLLRRHKAKLPKPTAMPAASGVDGLGDELNYFTQLVLDQAKSLYCYWPGVRRPAVRRSLTVSNGMRCASRPRRIQMPASTLEAEFHGEMIGVYKEAKAEGYPSIFLRMVNDMGGVATAKKLINDPTPSDGFRRLWELGRLDLTVEYVVAFQPKYRSSSRSPSASPPATATRSTSAGPPDRSDDAGRRKASGADGHQRRPAPVLHRLVTSLRQFPRMPRAQQQSRADRFSPRACTSAKR